MEKKTKAFRLLLVFGILVVVMSVVYGIFQVLSYSEDQLIAQSVQSIADNEGRDTHLAVGKNLNDGDFETVINASEEVQDVINNSEVTVVNFFASWCAPCQREVPELNDLYADTKDTDVAIIGININDKQDDRDQFIEKYEVAFPVYEFSNEDVGLDDYKVQLIPTTFFVNNSGEIIRAYIGEVNLNLLEAYVQYVKEKN